MTDDKALVDAYSSIYKKKEEIKEEAQQLDEIPLAIPALMKGAGLAMKALKIGRKVNQGVQVARGLMNTIKGEKQTMQTAGHEPEGEMIEDVAITHLDGTTTEVIDVIKPEPLGNPDEK